MKKFGKILLSAMLVLAMFFGFAQTVSLAAPDVGGIIDNIESQEAKPETEKANEIGAKIINWIWAISVVVAIIVLMIIGLKFILGSTSEKAEYKKSLIPVVVGVLVLVFATTIVRVLFGINK